MISYFSPRRCGKTTFALDRYLGLPNAIYVTFNSSSSRVIKKEIEHRLKEHKNPYYVKNKIENVYHFEEFLNKFTKPTNRPVIIDELPYMLKNLFGNVDTITGTTLRVDTSHIESELLNDYYKNEELYGYGSHEDFQLEILAEYYNMELESEKKSDD